MKWIQKNYKRVLKNLWWILLVITSGKYIYDNSTAFIETPSFVDNIVMTAFVILIFFPFISEISFMGMELKKDIADSKEELNKNIRDISMQVQNQLQLTQMNMSNEITQLKSEVFMMSINNKTNVYLGNDLFPTRREANDVITHSGVADRNNSTTMNEETGEVEKDFKASDEQTKLFQIRYSIESLLKKLSYKMGLSDQLSSKVLTTMFRHSGIIDTVLEEKIFKVLNICNRGIHGEIINEKYISYAEIVSDDIKENITKLIPKLEEKTMTNTVACPFCQYVGPSPYENFCPKCGRTSDEG